MTNWRHQLEKHQVYANVEAAQKTYEKIATLPNDPKGCDDGVVTSPCSRSNYEICVVEIM